MRRFPLLTCALAGLVLSAPLGPVAAQTSLFSQTPADPASGFQPSPAPAPAPVAPAPRTAPATRAAVPAARAVPVAPAPVATQAEPAAATPKPARPKPKGPQPARALTIVNASSGTITGIEIVGSGKTVSWAKPIAAGGRALVKLPVLKACAVSVTATYEAEGAGIPGDVDTCKDKTVRLTD